MQRKVPTVAKVAAKMWKARLVRFASVRRMLVVPELLMLILGTTGIHAKDRALLPSARAAARV